MYRERLPRSSVGDLIAIVRSLYFAWQEQGVNAAQLAELLQVGRDLRDALELSLVRKPSAAEQREAWLKAEQATAALCIMLEASEPANPALVAEAKRASARSA